MVLPLVILTIPLIWLLGREIYRDLENLQSADSDTVQWTLSQAEIEFLDFQLTLSADPGDVDLDALRRDFDILYSRVAILRDGRVFATVRQVPGFGKAVQEMQSFLDDTAPLIDGNDDALRAGLPALQEQVRSLRPLARQLFMQGLSHFADQSDSQRARLSATLRNLSLVIMTSLTALGLLFLYSRAANARTRQRERELEHANAHMQTILSTSLDAVIVSDHHGHVLDLNAAAESTFGYPLEHAKGKSIGDLIVPPELREAHRAGLERMISTGERKLVGHGRIRLEAMHANGTRLPVELALQSASGEQGEVIIAFLRDISAQLEAEDDLRNARDQALAGEKAKADFLTVMSHEIRTPLNGLLGNLTLIGQSRLDSEQIRFVRNMEISGRQLMKHVNAILDIAKFEAGMTVLSPTSFHLGRFLQEIVDGLSGQAEHQRSTIEWEWEGKPLEWVRTDHSRLEQILMNLVGNAIRFTQDGQIRIEAEQFRGNKTKCDVEFRVIDTGIGIPEEDQERIFEDFESRDMTHARTSGGTGLGLGIARRLVGALGGEIGVESTPGEGSVFWFRIPVTPVHAPDPEDEAPASQQPRVEPLSILVAEDNDINAFVARRMLEQDGHSVRIAQDGHEAVALATSTRFDVILMDISMPGMDGLEATRAIRAAAAPWNTVPILAFSANVLPEDTDRFRSEGMNGFISKPLQQEELHRALASTTGQNAAQAAPSAPALSGGLADMLDAGELADLTRDFLAEGDGFVDALDGVSAGTLDPGFIADECHRISGSAALFGAMDFRDALKALEAAARKDDRPGCMTGIETLRRVWETTRSAY